MTQPIHRNALKPGYELHWYRIERVLGQGSFGITYLARDLNLDQEVAIKEYLPMELAVREPDFSVQPAADTHGEQFKWGLDRFIAEAKTLARFKHPNIVRVLTVFEANRTGYMVMEYEHGDNLKDILTRRGTLAEDELLRIVLPILDGLETVHERGFIHRDIKPANLFIRANGSPVLIDFGSARQALGVETRTLTTLVSHGYAPYEQYYSKGEKQGPWTDFYGLGATLSSGHRGATSGREPSRWRHPRIRARSSGGHRASRKGPLLGALPEGHRPRAAGPSDATAADGRRLAPGVLYPAESDPAGLQAPAQRGDTSRNLHRAGSAEDFGRGATQSAEYPGGESP
ncbi:MAG: serine/threonine-protein kinase [Methylococcales bacterium]